MVSLVDVLEKDLVIVKVNHRAQVHQTNQKISQDQIAPEITCIITKEELPIYFGGETRTIDNTEVPITTIIEQYQRAMIEASKRGADYVNVDITVMKPGCLLGLFFPEKIKVQQTFYKRR